MESRTQRRKKHTIHQRHGIRPQLHHVQAGRDSRAHPGILPKKLRTIARKYFEPREALIYQLVLESDKLEEEWSQLTTRQKKKLDREIKNYVNIIIKTRKTPQEETQEEAQEEKETTRPSTQEETRKRKRTEDQKPTKKHKKNHPVET